MRTGEFLEGVLAGLREGLPPEWRDFRHQRRGHMIKLWYNEPRLHYEVWPVAGRDLIEAGLHFEAEAEVNLRLLRWFDPHIVALKAGLDGAVDLEQWTPSWGHLYRVFPAPSLGSPLQQEISDWLGRLIPLAEPLLQAGLAEIGPLESGGGGARRDWSEWRRRRARQREATRYA